MRVVGLLLISALMIVPSAIAQLLARSFRGRPCCSPASSGWWSASSGTATSYYTGHAVGRDDRAAGHRAVPAGHRRRSTLRERPPGAGTGDAPTCTTRTRTSTATACGHPPVPHGDHVDYDHDGHLHAPHRTGRACTTTSTGSARSPRPGSDERHGHGPRPRSRRSPAGGPPGSAAPLLDAAGRARRLPQRPGPARAAARARRLGRAGHGLPGAAGAGGRRAGRRPPQRRRRGGLPALLTGAPPPPGLPLVRAHGGGRRPAGRAVGRRVAAEHGFADVQHQVEVFGTCAACVAART